MTVSWALEMAGHAEDRPLTIVAREIVLRFAVGATRPQELPALQAFAQALERQAPLGEVDAALRELSYAGYLRGAIVVLASAIERHARADWALCLARELMDALDPETGIRLAQAVLALPEVDADRENLGSCFVQANRLLGDAMLERNDPHAALRHFEAVLAVDVDDRRALRGWAAATRILEQRGVAAEHRSHGLALLGGLEDLDLGMGLGVERYELGRPLGRGRHAVVYQAFDRKVGRDVAIKRLVEAQTRRGLPQRALQARFFAEAKTLARVRSPYVVALYDVAPAHKFIALELCRGGNLRVALRRGLVGPDDMPRIGAQLHAALAAVHVAGAVHRDVKPANILVREARRNSPIALADFGLAIDPSPHTADARAGTLRYLAPELRSHSARATPASDRYAAGVVLLELALAPSPLPEAFDRLDGPGDPDPWIPRDLPELWRARFLRLLSPSSEDRTW